VQQLGVVYAYLEVGYDGLRQDKPRILCRNPHLKRLLVQRKGFQHVGFVGLGKRALLPSLGSGKHFFRIFRIEPNVALGLLFEADSDTMADKLVGGGPREPFDAEPKHYLLQRRRMARFESLHNKRLKLFGRVFPGLFPNFYRGFLRVAGSVSHVQHA